MEKALIIGLGAVGLRYDLCLNEGEYVLTHARAISQSEKYELSGAVDISNESRLIFASRYNVPVYSDINEALSEINPHLVVISVPTDDHLGVFKRVMMETSVKIILCEKPLSKNLDDALYMVEAAKQNNIKLFVNFMRRADPGVLEIKRMIDAGEMGNDFKGVVWYSKGFFHNASHFMDLMRFFFGDVNYWRIINSSTNTKSSDLDLDVNVSFALGDVTFLSVNEDNFSHYCFEVISSKGRLRYELGGEVIEWQLAQPDLNYRSYTTLTGRSTKISSDLRRAQANVMHHLENLSSKHINNLCTGEEGYRILKCMTKIVESI